MTFLADFHFWNLIIITVGSKKSKRRFFKVGNGSGFQWIPNILKRLKVQILSTHSEDFKNFGPAVRNFYPARRIFYEVWTLDFQKYYIFKAPKISMYGQKSPGFAFFMHSTMIISSRVTKYECISNFTYLMSSLNAKIESPGFEETLWLLKIASFSVEISKIHENS